LSSAVENFSALKIILPASLAIHIITFNLGFGLLWQVALFIAFGALVWRVANSEEEDVPWDQEPSQPETQQAPASSDETSRPSAEDEAAQPESASEGTKERSSPDSVVKLHELTKGDPQKQSDFWDTCRDAVEREVVNTLNRGHPGMKHVNCWTPAPASSFPVRGKKYLSDGKKIVPDSFHFEPIGVDTFTIEAAQSNIAPWRDGVLSQVKRIAARAGHECPRVLVVNWMVPGSPQINHVQYYAERPFTPITEDDKLFKKMLDHFMTEGNDDFRRKRFKLIASVQEGPWVLKQSTNKPAIIGKKIEMTTHVGEGYLEITIDISTSKIAARVVGMATSTAKSLVIDMAYVIEGRKEAELPERLLGGIRIHHIDMSSIQTGPKLPIPK